MYKTDYKAIAASQTDSLLGKGTQGDMLSRLIITPANLNPGVVSIKDGNGSAITIFTGGIGSVADLSPVSVEIEARCNVLNTPGWRVTTGADVSLIAVGRFA